MQKEDGESNMEQDSKQNMIAIVPCKENLYPNSLTFKRTYNFLFFFGM